MVRPAWSACSAILVATVLAGCAGTAGHGAAAPSMPEWPASRWRVVAVMEGNGGRIAVPDGTPVDLAFDATATRASGSAGCNRYTASATVDGARVAFGPAAASKRMCPGPAMAVEAAFLAALPRVATARLDGDRLLLADADGARLLDLVRAAPE